MPLPDIQLDNRSYNDLVNELRRRIPAYTPEWTDFNESDPGIVLIEMFAWLADILIYRINQIPDKAYVKFLQMIDIQLSLPTPAQAYLTFTVTSQNAVQIPSGTRVQASGASSGQVTFETVDDLYAAGVNLAAVQIFDGAVYSVVTNFNTMDASPYYAFGKSPQAGSALYLGFDNPYPATGGIRYPLTILVNTPSVTGSTQGGQNIQTVSPPVVFELEYSTATGWGTVSAVTDGTNALTQTGVLSFQAPANWASVQWGALRRTTDPGYYWMRFRISQNIGSGYQSPPQLTNILTNSVMALNAETAQGEMLGASNGMPNQSFQISNFPVLQNLPGVNGIVQVNEGDGSGYTLWKEVPDFSGCDANRKVYTLDHSTGIVTFGNGVLGKIPHWWSADNSNREASDTPNIQVTQYQFGGGVAGNVGSDTITSLVDTIPFVASVTNLLPAQLGGDQQTVADAEGKAPQQIQTISRAVATSDFVTLAIQSPGARIQRATAIPLQRPQTQVVRAADGSVIVPPPAPGVLTVIVVPDGPNPKRPVATDQTLAKVAAYLDNYRLVTCELYVTNPVYRLVEIKATITVVPGSATSVVRTAVENALLDFYSPLKGGQKGTGWDFGGTLYVSDAYRQILDVVGVQRVEGVIDIYIDNQQQPQDEDIPLQPFELVYSINHTLHVSYSQ
jgi:predicted phage baseplate assembly protein